ncbi:PHD finger protein 21B isoform X2 [Dromiciops gliroides]|uniref:PHD finger protein 21B isoform X2 n=1 Tax=Dromiciops gliroides TaxID=33562 RepID=UPI001CC51B78|nr:PHD finger protein 21B isoform X2 [Dromiciops gliroides]
MELQSLQEALKVGIQGHQNGDLKKQLVERHSRLPALSERQVRLAPAVLHSSAGPEALGTIAAVPIKVPQVSSLHRLAGQGPAALPQVRPKTLIPDSLPISPCRERPSKQAPAFQKATVVSIKNPSPALPTANNTGNQPVAEPAALTSPLSGAGVAYAIISTSPSNAASPIKPSSTTATATTVSMVSDSIKVQPLLISADNKVSERAWARDGALLACPPAERPHRGRGLGKVIIIQPQVQTQPDSKAETQKPPEELPQGVQASKKKKEAAPDVQESPEKIAFMVALGLVTAEHLEEIQSKRQERKRRSTANPAYSGLLETERKRLASNCLNSPLFLSTRANEESCWKNEISHEEVCVTCKRGTDLQPCGTCPGAYHLSCLDPPLKTAPKGVWVCPKCQEKVLNKDENVPWTGMLAIVHSYVTHKTVKEEEKRKLLKRGSELKSEHRQLEEKDRLLNSAVKKCLELKTSLLARRKGAQSSLERLRTLLRLIQNEQMLQVTMTTTTASASPLLAVPWIKPAAASATVAMHTALPQAQGNN